MDDERGRWLKIIEFIIGQVGWEREKILAGVKCGDAIKPKDQRSIHQFLSFVNDCLKNEASFVC
jgi:hypothetical protein